MRSGDNAHPINSNVVAASEASLVRTMDSSVDDVLGRIGGRQLRRKFGYAADLGAAIVIGTPATWVDIWSQAGLRTPPTADKTPFVASDAAGDTTDVTVEGLDTNGDRISVTVTLTGTTPVTTGTVFSDVLRMYNAGATAFVGTVSCVDNNDFTAGVPDDQGEILCEIPIGDDQSQLLAERCPTGKQYLLQALDIRVTRDSGAAGSVILALSVMAPGGVFRRKLACHVGTGDGTPFSLKGIIVPAGGVVQLRARDVSDNGTFVSASMTYLEVDA